MNKIYGVIFKNNGKEYYFDGSNFELEKDAKVIVETEKGLQYGKVTNLIDKSSVKNIKEYKNIIRKASKKDEEQYLENLKLSQIALKKARNIAKQLDLSMTFIDASFTFDKNQLLLNFYADERVDFRELAKRLASIYKTRIELRQLGARDRAAKCGGVGVCGKILCCSSFLKHMDSVSMNMAKNQNISLNPSKINGSCGRLLCCLKYEDDEYSKCLVGLPQVGKTVDTKFGEGIVRSVNILKREFKVEIDGQIYNFSVDENNVMKEII